MNLIRTIQAGEQQSWVNLLFVPGPHKGSWVPLYPFRLPFPCRLRQGLVNGYVYLLYQRRLVGYGIIEKVVPRQSAMLVGTNKQSVRSGDTVVIDGVYKRMPTALQQVEARGFMGPRYTNLDLHTLTPNAVRAALTAANVLVY